MIRGSRGDCRFPLQHGDVVTGVSEREPRAMRSPTRRGSGRVDGTPVKMRSTKSSDDVRALFKKRRRWLLLIALLYLAIVVFVFALGLDQRFHLPSAWPAYLAVILMLIDDIFLMRCPACGKYVGRVLLTPRSAPAQAKQCPNCGVQLLD